MSIRTLHGRKFAQYVGRAVSCGCSSIGAAALLWKSVSPRVSHGISEHLPVAHANLHIYTFRRHESSQDSSASFFSSFGTYSLILRKLSAYCISRPFFSLASFAVPANHSFIMSSHCASGPHCLTWHCKPFAFSSMVSLMSM